MVIADPPALCNCGCHYSVPLYVPPPAPIQYMPVNMPIPKYAGDYTIATLDHDGNLTIETNQPAPPELDGE